MLKKEKANTFFVNERGENYGLAIAMVRGT